MDLQDLTGSAFESADLTGARFERVLLNDVRIHNADLHRIVMHDVEIVDGVIEGDVASLVINGVDVAPMVEAELNRRDPERAAFRPTTAAGFREAWVLNTRLWDATVTRARALDPELLHTSVAGEWSFVQTLRHLAFASQAWVARGVLGEVDPWHPLSLPWDEMEPRAGVPWDRDARPTLDEALEVRHATMEVVRQVLEDLTDEGLDAVSPPLVGSGWPDEGATYPVRTCLSIVLNEERHHRLYAERDLAVLEQS